MKKEFIRQNVGVDMAKDDFKVSLMSIQPDLQTMVGGSHTFANSEQGFKDFVEWAKQKTVDLPLNFTMEATGVYYEGLAYFLLERGFTVHVVLPNQSKKYGQSLGIKSKTDKIDARILAQMGLERHLQAWRPVSGTLRVLKQLTRERDSLVQERTNVANQLHAYLHQGKPNETSVARAAERINFLGSQIREIEKEVAASASRDKALKSKLSYLTSIPGVGLLTAVVIAAETNGFASITSIKQLTSYAGMDVQIRESGAWKGKSRISKKGNSRIRKALFLPSFTKVKFDKPTGEYYERLKEKKGKAMVAAVATQRKLLGLMYTLWKKEEMYRAAA